MYQNRHEIKGTAVKSRICLPTRRFVHPVTGCTHEMVQDRETPPCPGAGRGTRGSHVPAY